jgi:hypothetical protein
MKIKIISSEFSNKICTEYQSKSKIISFFALQNNLYPKDQFWFCYWGDNGIRVSPKKDDLQVEILRSSFVEVIELEKQ